MKLNNSFTKAFCLGRKAQAEPQVLVQAQAQVRRIFSLGNDASVAQTYFGHYMVIPNFNLDVAIGVFRDGLIEAHTTNVVKDILRPGDKYINVGANFGYYAVLGASLVQEKGKVYAIEANPHVFSYLVKSTFWAGFPHTIDSYCCAAFDQDGQEINITFDPQFWGGGQTNDFKQPIFSQDLGKCMYNGENISFSLDENFKFIPKGLMTSAPTKTAKIDTLLSTVSDVRLMHMDIEGNEPWAVEGAKKLIERSPSIQLILEWDPAWLMLHPSRVEIVRSMWNYFLKDKGYKAFSITPCSINQYPILEELTLDSIYNVVAGDILLRK